MRNSEEAVMDERVEVLAAVLHEVRRAAVLANPSWKKGGRTALPHADSDMWCRAEAKDLLAVLDASGWTLAPKEAVR